MTDNWQLKKEDILTHILFDKYNVVPFGWHLLVVREGEPWDELMRHIDNDTPIQLVTTSAFARTTLEHEPLNDGSIGSIYLRADSVWVGMVAHEAMHLASWMCRFIDKVPRRMTMGREPEMLAELTGVLTSLAWYNLEALRVD